MMQRTIIAAREDRAVPWDVARASRVFAAATKESHHRRGRAERRRIVFSALGGTALAALLLAMSLAAGGMPREDASYPYAMRSSQGDGGWEDSARD